MRTGRLRVYIKVNTFIDTYMLVYVYDYEVIVIDLDFDGLKRRN